MIMAIGLELSATTDMAAIAVAGREESGRWLADLMFYGSPDDAVAQCSRLERELDTCGVFCDPMPCAGVVDDLRVSVWLHLLEATDVAAAAWQFVTEVRGRRVRLGSHPALRESMRAAVPRPLALRFAFERRRVTADMSPLNAAAFALWGARKNDGAAAEPGVWVIEHTGPRVIGPAGWTDGIPPWVRGDAAWNESVPPWERRP